MYKISMDFNMGRGAYQNITDIVNNNGVPNTIVEVGVFEGSTTFWMADNLTPHNKNLKIYAIDPHVGSNDMSEDFNVVQSNFVSNLEACQHKNVEYVRKHSKQGLIDLINRGVQVEFAYIDGDHKAAEVLEDLVLTWQLLAVGGIVLCDDTTTWKYKDTNGTYSAQMSPRMAIEMFLQCNWHKIQILSLPDGSQTAFRKISQ